MEALETYPECQQALDLIGKLFEIQRGLPNWRVIRGPKLRAAALARTREVRTDQSKALTEDLLAWAKEQRGLPGSLLRQAIAYMTSNWRDLTHFLEEPGAPLSNNAAE